MPRIITALTLIPVSLLAAGALTSCAAGPFAGAKTTEERPIEAVTSVALESVGDLVIREGDPRLVITAGSRTMEQLTSEVSGGELVLGTRENRLPFGVGEIDYELWLPSLKSIRVDGAGDVDGKLPVGDLTIEVSGAGDVEFVDVDGGTVTVDLDGAGDVSLGGTTSSLVVRVNGAGDIDADDLEADDVTVEVDGTGEVQVWAKSTLDVKLSGIATVRYTGDPEISGDVSGVGEVVRD